MVVPLKIFWFNYYIHDVLNIKEQQSYQSLRSIPQENDARCNGGLYMIKGITSVAYGVMLHEKANTKHLPVEGLYSLKWIKKQVPKIKNEIFQTCALMIHYEP